MSFHYTAGTTRETNSPYGSQHLQAYPLLSSFRGCNTQRESLCAWSSRWWSRTPARAVIAAFAFALEMGERYENGSRKRAKLLEANTESTQAQVGKLLQSYLSAMLSSHLAFGHFLNNVMPPVIIHNDDKSSYGAFFPLRFHLISRLYIVTELMVIFVLLCLRGRRRTIEFLQF
jgi:hypothetical protein